jgi:signal transduction histidine kinase
MRSAAEPAGRTLVPPLAPEAAMALLRPPRVPAASASRVALARRAATLCTPVLLAAPAAGGRLLLARALHALAGRGGPLIAAVGRRPPLGALPAGATLYLDVGRLAPEAALALEAVLDDAGVWVIAGVEPDAAPPPALAVRFEGVVLSIPPLAARLAELPALAEATLAALAARSGTTPPTLAPEALARLQAHAWPGDVAELEAVLGRALLLAAGQPIAAEHVVLEAAPSPVVAMEAAPAPAVAPPPGDGDLEYLLAELAHELRNPLVTIKTFAGHLPALLEDAELRARFSTLTDDAIARMDGLLENLLAFARLGPPRLQAVEVGPLLARVLTDVEPELAGRELRVRQSTTPAARCAGDPDHLTYALRNLFAGVVREVPAREELALDTTANGVVTLHFAAGGAAFERLRRLATPESTSADGSTLGDPTLLPLSFRLARAVLARNGGALTVVPEAGTGTTLVIRLPTAHADEGGNVA